MRTSKAQDAALVPRGFSICKLVLRRQLAEGAAEEETRNVAFVEAGGPVGLEMRGSALPVARSLQDQAEQDWGVAKVNGGGAPQ